jgi:signal transduction histidine kinase/ActR/RegA family two-component response regulator
MTSGLKERIFHRIPLTTKIVLVTISVGAVVWFASDYFGTRMFTRTFENYLMETMGLEAVEQRKAFDNYVKSHSQAAKLFISQKGFVDYIESPSWSGEVSKIEYHKVLPGWLPRGSVMRLVVEVRYALLLDGEGRVREVYLGEPKPPPDALLNPSVILRQLSHNQSFMTEIDGKPFLVTSESVRSGGSTIATLMLASPLDEEFLTDSQGIPKLGRFVALVSGEDPRIIASSAPELLPPGTLLEDLEGRYYITGKGFFDYGASDLGIGFAAIVSKDQVDALTQSILPRDRLQNAMIATMFILSFALIMLMITRRIVRLTGRVNEFSTRALGGNPQEHQRGDEMDILEERFQILTEEVVSSSEALRKARDELEVRVEERTSELRKLLTTLNALVDHMPEGVVLLDVENRVVLANPIGNKYLKTLSGAETGDVIKEIRGHLLEDLLVSPPHIIWHEIEVPGQKKSVFQAAARLIGQTDSPGGIVLVLKDVTEESEFKEHIHQQERLAAVGKLAAGIAHDFNNILTIIIGYIEMLKDAGLPEEAGKAVEIIHESGHRAANLIRQMLDFSRLSASEPEVINLIIFVSEFTEFIRRTIPENIKIAVNYEPGEYLVSADPTKMQQVLANLAVNARDAMPQGGKLSFGLSRLSLKPGDKPPLLDMPPGDWVTLSVVDTGEGIPPEVLPKVFEPFFSTKGIGRGTGLGLSQVYGIVTQHGGFIDVKSSPEVGTAFTLYLSAVHAPEETSPEEAPESPLEGHGETIMIVEDDEAVLNLSRRILSGLGYKLITATNGTDALELFRRRRNEISLIVTDIVMPEMGGLELCREVKKINPHVKVIAISGYPLGEQLEELHSAGIEQFLTKPIQKQTLAVAVNRAFNKQ